MFLYKNICIVAVLLLILNSTKAMVEKPLSPLSPSKMVTLKTQLKYIVPAAGLLVAGSGLALGCTLGSEKLSWKPLACGASFIASGLSILAVMPWRYSQQKQKQKGFSCYNDALIDLGCESSHRNEPWEKITLYDLIKLKKIADLERKRRLQQQLQQTSLFITIKRYFASTDTFHDPLEHKITIALAPFGMNKEDYIAFVDKQYKETPYFKDPPRKQIPQTDSNYLFSNLPDETFTEINRYVQNAYNQNMRHGLTTVPISRYEFLMHLIPYLYLKRCPLETYPPTIYFMTQDNEKKCIQDSSFNLHCNIIYELLTMHRRGFKKFEKNAEGAIEIYGNFGLADRLSKIIPLQEVNKKKNCYKEYKEYTCT